MRTITAGILCLQFDAPLAPLESSPMDEVDEMLGEINDILRNAMPDSQPNFTRHIIYPTQVVVNDSTEPN